VELVVPAGSQQWVSHQLHQQRLDPRPAFQELLALLEAEGAAARKKAKAGSKGGGKGGSEAGAAAAAAAAAVG
jgi:hypothetical protein